MPAAEAVHPVEHDDAVADRGAGRRVDRPRPVTSREPGARARRVMRRPSRRRADDVAEHRTGLDRGQLVGVADEHQPGARAARRRGAGPSATARPSTSRRRRRRRTAAGWRGRGGSGCGWPGRQPSSRWSVERAEGPSSCARIVRRGRRGRAPRRAPPPRGGPPPCRSGRRARSERGGGPSRGLLGEQRDDARDGRGLAGAGPAGDHREPAAARRPRPRAAGSRRPAAPRTSRSRPVAPARRASTCRRGGAAQRGEVGGDAALLAPVAVEVERACRRSRSGRSAGRRPRPRARAGAPARATHAPASGQGRAATSTGSSVVGDGRVAHGGEVDADVAERAAPRTASATASSTAGVGLAAERARARRATWTSAASSTPASSNVGAADPARGARATGTSIRRSTGHAPAAPIERVGERRRRARRRPPGERRRTGGRRRRGVAAPVMPRRNR